MLIIQDIAGAKQEIKAMILITYSFFFVMHDLSENIPDRILLLVMVIRVLRLKNCYLSMHTINPSLNQNHLYLMTLYFKDQDYY
jgi:hypothetical protein